MTERRAIALVARREITSRVRERSFLISTFVTILLLVGVGVGSALLGGDDGQELRIAATGGEAVRIAEAARAGGDAFDTDVTVTRVDTDAAARAAVEDERADVALAGRPVRIVVQDDVEDDTAALLQQAAALTRQTALLERSDVPQAAREAILRPPPLAVDALDRDAGDQDARQGIASLAVIVLYGQLLLYGYWLSAGIVEEKSSRVVEVLLSAIRPRALLVGKLVGIGLLGLVQLLIIAVVGAGTAIASGALEVESAAYEAVLVVLGFFVLGYVVYAAMFAVAGAIVPRQEDLQSSTTPLTVLLVLSFFVAIGAVGDPDGTLAGVLTYVPLSAPMILPVRIVVGEVAAWEVVLSVLLMGLTAAALVAAAVRIYANAILRTGGRVRLGDAWRAG